MGPLDDDRAPPLAAIAAYYDQDLDQALIELRYDALALGDERLGFVIEIALLAEIGMIQPAELSEGDRRRFLGERLTRCTIIVVGQRTVVAAMTELVRRIREYKSTQQIAPKPVASVPLKAASLPPPVPAARGLPRGDTSDPVMLVHAKGTRDDLPPSQMKIPKSTRNDLATHNDLSDPIEPPAPPRFDLPRAARRDDRNRVLTPNVIPRVHRAATVEMSPHESHRMATESMPGPPASMPRPGMPIDPVAMRPATPPPTPVSPRRARSPSKLHTEPYLPATADAMPPGIIYARYLRSGRWVPIRIGALSLKGAALMAGALPRVKDHVDIALSFSTHRALVRGNVNKVSTVHEAAMSGTTTFSVTFQLDDAAKRQLTALLTAARAANVTIKPPPARLARRYPVEWPVSLGTPKGAVRAEALDVSRDGMFVKPIHPLMLETALTFSTVLDDGGPPISGRAKVVRQITDAEARVCGLAPGFGLQLTDMGENDRERWLAFIARIEKRADKRVLVGASPARLAELQNGLASAGYAVTGGTDPGALVQLASAEARPVDAALIDASWTNEGVNTGWVEALFAARSVPHVSHAGDARRARTAIDKLFGIE